LSTGGALLGTLRSFSDVGSFSFTIKAQDTFGDSQISPQYTIVVSYPAMNITTINLPTGYIGSVYPSPNLAATGGTGLSANYLWVVAPGSNALPAGLNLSTGGMISGTPTGSPSGPTSITFKVTDNRQRRHAQ